MTGPDASSPDIAVLDYGAGNLHSVTKAVERVGATSRLVRSPEELGTPDGVVLPGVGNFGHCAEMLRSARLDFAVFEWLETGRPFLGICVGMQLLYEASEEASDPGLALIEGRVRELPDQVRVPHMGWNTVSFQASDGVRSSSGSQVNEAGPSMFSGFEPYPWFYFVHSFAADGPVAGWRESRVAWSRYGTDFVAAVEIGSLWATQFHPEKSGIAGLKLISNFAKRCVAAAD